MKKALFTFIFLCLHGIVFSQVNIEKIKKNVTENPQKYYYEYLEIFKTAPETISQEQLNYIYYGNNYVDYGYDKLTFNQKSGKISKFAHNRISKKFAEKTGEKVYLQIYLHKNKANEPYNELVISNETEIELAKLQLITSIQKYL